MKLMDFAKKLRKEARLGSSHRIDYRVRTFFTADHRIAARFNYRKMIVISFFCVIDGIRNGKIEIDRQTKECHYEATKKSGEKINKKLNEDDILNFVRIFEEHIEKI